MKLYTQRRYEGEGFVPIPKRRILKEDIGDIYSLKAGGKVAQKKNDIHILLKVSEHSLSD